MGRLTPRVRLLSPDRSQALGREKAGRLWPSRPLSGLLLLPQDLSVSCFPPAEVHRAADPAVKRPAFLWGFCLKSHWETAVVLTAVGWLVCSGVSSSF